MSSKTSVRWVSDRAKLICNGSENIDKDVLGKAEISTGLYMSHNVWESIYPSTPKTGKIQVPRKILLTNNDEMDKGAVTR